MENSQPSQEITLVLKNGAWQAGRVPVRERIRKLVVAAIDHTGAIGGGLGAALGQIALCGLAAGPFIDSGAPSMEALGLLQRGATLFYNDVYAPARFHTAIQNGMIFGEGMARLVTTVANRFAGRGREW